MIFSRVLYSYFLSFSTKDLFSRSSIGDVYEEYLGEHWRKKTHAKGCDHFKYTIFMSWPRSKCKKKIFFPESPQTQQPLQCIIDNMNCWPRKTVSSLPLSSLFADLFIPWLRKDPDRFKHFARLIEYDPKSV